MKKTAKGTRNEKRCEDELKRLGYITWRVRRNKFANMDWMGIWDVCGWHRDNHQFLFVQCKSNRVDKKTMRIVIGSNEHLPLNCFSQVWVWHDRNSPKKMKGWEIIR